MSKSYDAIVVGGGAVGGACAYHLAKEGASVLLLERDRPGAGASGAAAGIIGGVSGGAPADPWGEFCRESFAIYPALMAELAQHTPIDPEFRQCGMLRLALDAGEAAVLRANAAALSQWDIEWLTPDQARALEPQVTPRLLGALWSPREGNVYSPQLTAAYVDAAARLGAEARWPVAVRGLAREGARVTGVQLDHETIAAGHVVLAAGAWMKFCAPWVPADLPVDPIRGQILALEATPPALRVIVYGAAGYIVPKTNGTIVIGATEEEVGFDNRVTADGLAALLRIGPPLVPALATATFHHAWSGLRPALPDRLPAIGGVPGLAGVSIATGHFRTGVLLSAVTGRWIADRILHGREHRFAATFSPGRFAARR